MRAHMCMHARALAGINMQCCSLNYEHTFLGGWGGGECLCLQLVVFQVNREKEFSEEQMCWNEE